MKLILSFFAVCFFSSVFAQFNQNTTPSYLELISIYKRLATEHQEIELYQMGDSDYGLPIYLCVLNGSNDSIQTFKKAQEQTTILINNGIHPGEPDGVNACLIWIDNWVKSGKKTKKLPVIGIIPAYNVGGMMNRSGTSRANQDGPEEYGFRGNAQNLDLNRDFIKMDSKNMFTFAKIFHALDPDIFLDTHVSNGADYQYTMTYIASVRERMAPMLGDLMYEDLIPHLSKMSSKRGYDLIPYVDLKGATPEYGIQVFNDLPRYAMGYASLMNAISFTLETHMLKPFPDRVKATEVFIDETISWTIENQLKVERARAETLKWEEKMRFYPFNFKLTDDQDSIAFKGYKATNMKSEVTGLKRLKYHHNQPYDQQIPYFKTYEAADSVLIPDFYLLGSQCVDVLERLDANNVQYARLKNDTSLQLATSKIVGFETSKKPYEGHYLHNEVKEDVSLAVVNFKKGDVLIPTHQKNKRFIISVLESRTPDSYFAWNFFDSYLQQKEYFSAYVFEDKAALLLKNNQSLKTEFEEKKNEDEDFRNSAWNQLYFIYQRSPYYEPSHNVLPINKGMFKAGE